MAIRFTDRQQRVVDARGHNVLVSAAAGSGKTAVLTGRIVGMVCDPEHPVNIDRLLVVTFTKAAAAEMRERIGKALRERLAEDPANTHLQAQEVLLQKAQITTIDSFCTYVLRNHFSAIDLDPGFRQMDQTEADLLRADVMDAFLEEQYAGGDPAFLACEEYFCLGGDDRRLSEMILTLLQQAESHPRPLLWLRRHREDYACGSPAELMESAWMRSCALQMLETAEGIRMDYNMMVNMCLQGGGPYPYERFLRGERGEIFEHLSPEKTGGMPAEELLRALRKTTEHTFDKLPSITAKKYPDVDPAARESVRKLRDGAKKKLAALQAQLRSADAEALYAQMQTVAPHVRTLFDLTIAFREQLAAEKREKNAIDFSDLEHFALEILTQEREDGSLGPSETAKAFRKHYHEILIDEYQDSNEVQEVLLGMISGEQEGRRNRFMVGDVKQSIYKFRLARPEIFMEKYDTYTPGSTETERIDLDQNFRSRTEVLDSVNAVFGRIMRREIGGIDYTEEAALKPGASYSIPADSGDGDPYRTELLFVCTKEEDSAPADDASETADPSEELTNPQKEASVIAAKIRELAGHFLLQDKDTGQLRPARYGDIVILLRSAAGWNEQFREVFEKEGIPVHVDSRTGYFAAQEIREALQLLRVLLNPRQDLYLYGVLHGFFGGFSGDEIAVIRAFHREDGLCDALEQYAAEGTVTDLAEKSAAFLRKIRRWRARVPFCTVAQILTLLFEETGYTDHCAALPAGEQRTANLQLLMAQADAFDRMSYTGLLRFLRYIDSIRQRELDAGEANILDEHADVVRIMTIHKSKGLEFPICFVAGLAKRYSFRTGDRGSGIVIDSDWGVGVDMVDTRRRVRGSTLRRTAIEEKILRDSLGEELRVLYVAMTRAKEKLYLVMQVGSPEKTFAKWDSRAEAYWQIMRGKGPLPAEMLRSSGSFAELLYIAVSGEAGMRAGEIGETGSPLFRTAVCMPGDVSEALEEELLSLARRKEILLRAEQAAENGAQGDLSAVCDPVLAEKLRERLSRRYAREDLRGLYLKTSVSELKHAAIERLAERLNTEEEAAGEGAAELFPDTAGEEYIPSFARASAPGESDTAMAERRTAVSGTAYGTAVHRFMECADLLRREEIAADPQPFIDQMERDGLLAPEQAAALPRRKLSVFFRSPLAERMERAALAGKLRKEQPFVLGIPADRLRPTLPHDETVMIQGIMDAFFVEEGGIVLIDYKTDRVDTGEELAERYRVQIDCYTEALERILEMPVRERILYSFALQEEVRL